MKIAIIIHSQTGHTKKVAELIGEGISQEKGCEYSIMPIENVDKEYVKEASAVLFGTPTYYANMSWQMKKFIDEYGVGLAGKLAGVFSTANVMGGGSETALLTMINLLMVKGMLLYSGGQSQGQPITHLGLASINEVPLEQQEDKIKIFGKRMASKANELFA